MQQVSSARTAWGRGCRRVVGAAGRVPEGLRRACARFAGTTRDAGLATAEYAVVMIAAVGFAGLLVVILRSAEIRETLTNLVRDALAV